MYAKCEVRGEKGEGRREECKVTSAKFKMQMAERAVYGASAFARPKPLNKDQHTQTSFVMSHGH
jgi:hypothetical protein